MKHLAVFQGMELKGLGPQKQRDEALRQVFGFSAFRANQQGVVDAILEGKDTFVVMPTGGGKSLCYQLPAHLLPGTCLVVSPLISLMKDQVDAAVANGLKAAFLNSSQSSAERAATFSHLKQGKLDLLYISPERFAMPAFREVLKGVKLCLLAVDEAHCISEWGHDFRPDYLVLSELIPTFPETPLAAFTATATMKVQRDIVEKLGLRDPLIVRASFNRPNLFYQVVEKGDLSRQLLSFVRSHPNESGIIYRTTRKSVEQTAEMLRRNGIEAKPYHAGLSDEVRAAHQEAFNRDEVQVVVATIAFGLGIDKSNVRYVVHGDLPKNLESYYQETGRAGRDGEPAQCQLFFGRGDIVKIRYFIDQIEDDAERQRALRLLNEMIGFCEVNYCRRRRLLGYFGEDFSVDDCGGCDVCAGEVETVPATREGQLVLSAVFRTGQRFGATHIVDVLRGADSEKICRFGHDQLSCFGLGRDHQKQHWRRVIDTLIAKEYLAVSNDQYPVLQLLPRAKRLLKGEEELFVLKRIQKHRRGKPASLISTSSDFNPELFDELRKLRLKLARRKRVPPYIIFSDRSLREMAERYPVTLDELSLIHGVGDVKLDEYGDEFILAIQRFFA